MDFRFRAWDKDKKDWAGVKELTLNYVSLFYKMEFELTIPEHIHVMQWTGLGDRNGVDIYDGDILGVVSIHDSNAFDNIWNNEKQSPIPQIIKQITASEWEIPSDISYNPGYWEVIGNIYENPELVDKANNYQCID